MQTYFSKRRLSVVDIVCITGWILCVPVVIFMQNGIPIGMPVTAVLAVLYIFCRGARVKDSEVDALFARMTEAQGQTLDPHTTLHVYDLAVSPIVKGKDGRLRTPVHIVSRFTEDADGGHIAVYRLNLLDETVEHRDILLPPGEPLTLTETPLPTPVGRRMRRALTSPLFGGDIPVSTDDIHAARLVERLCTPRS